MLVQIGHIAYVRTAFIKTVKVKTWQNMCICIHREKLKMQDRGPARGEKNSIILTEE